MLSKIIKRNIGQHQNMDAQMQKLQYLFRRRLVKIILVQWDEYTYKYMLLGIFKNGSDENVIT